MNFPKDLIDGRTLKPVPEPRWHGPEVPASVHISRSWRQSRMGLLYGPPAPSAAPPAPVAKVGEGPTGGGLDAILSILFWLGLCILLVVVWESIKWPAN